MKEIPSAHPRSVNAPIKATAMAAASEKAGSQFRTDFSDMDPLTRYPLAFARAVATPFPI